MMMEMLSSPSFRHLLCTSSEFQLLDFIQQGKLFYFIISFT